MLGFLWVADQRDNPRQVNGVIGDQGVYGGPHLYTMLGTFKVLEDGSAVHIADPDLRIDDVSDWVRSNGEPVKRNDP